MMIALYRTGEGSSFEYRQIMDRAGTIVVRSSFYGNGSTECASIVELLGPISGKGSRVTVDRSLVEYIKSSLHSGFCVLYGHVPPEVSSTVNRYLSERVGVEAMPDTREGIPVWQSSPRVKGARPSYLLFTVLSSVVK